MKIAIVLASLLSMAPLAQAAQSLAHPGEEVHAPALITDDMVIAAAALGNISDDALDLAKSYAALAEVKSTVAASYLADLINDARSLKHSAQRLNILLDEGESAKKIEAELDTLELKYLATTRGAAKVSLQLSSQGETFEGYQLKAAFNKVRARYVYLQTVLVD